MQRVKSFFIEAYYFMTSFVFLKHAFFIFVTFAASIWLLFWYLSWYTLHGETIEVPSVVGLTVPDAERLLATRSLKLKVVDERDDEDKPRNAILEQFPRSGQKVKESRTIYLIINAQNRKNVQLYYKSVIGVPLSSLEQKLSNLKLKVKNVQLIDGRGENTVAELRLNERILFKEADGSKGIRPPTAPVDIPSGSALTIVVYRGENNKLRAVPDLLCLTYSAAELNIKASQFILGETTFEPGIVDSSDAYVIGQDPLPNAMHIPSTPVRIKMAKAKPKECEVTDIPPTD